MSRISSARVEAVDLARGVALIGMMLVHLGPMWIDRDPPWGDVIAGGRAAPLFAMLAGVSLSLVHRRDPRGVGSIRATCIRGVILIAMGVALGSLDDMPVYIILAFYGLMIVLALPFSNVPPRALTAFGLLWAVIAPVVLLWLQINHGPVLSGQLDKSDLWPPWSFVTEALAWGAYPAGVWFAYVLVGLAVGQLDLTRQRTAGALALGGAGLVVATLMIGRIALARGAVEGDGWRGLFAHSPYPFSPATWDELWLVGEHTSRPLNVLSAIGSAFLVIGLCALIAQLPWSTWLAPLRAAGAMTLTLYTVHVLWTWRSRSQLSDSPEMWGSYERWLLQVIVLLAFAYVWQRWIGRGPLESVVRWLSITVPRRINAALSSTAQH